MSLETATGETPTQDIATRIENQLYPDAQEEPIEIDEEVVSEDEEILPEDDDTESEEEDGSDDLEDDEEEQTLASYLGVDDDRITVNEDGSVTLDTIVDGEKKAVPLSELAKSYQIQGHVNNKSIALEAQRKEFETVRSQVSEEMQTRVEGLNNMAQLVEDQLVSEFSSIDWDRLRAENPSEWTALRQEYAEKAQSIQQVKSLAGEEAIRLKTEQEEKFHNARSEVLKAEFAKMIENNPSWQDETKRTDDLNNIRSFLTSSYGFGEEDMQHVTDHRLLSLIQDAKAYREGKKAVEKKITKAVPKFQKPGASKAQTSSAAKARQVKAKRAAVKKSGHISDVASLILDRM